VARRATYRAQREGLRDIGRWRSRTQAVRSEAALARYIHASLYPFRPRQQRPVTAATGRAAGHRQHRRPGLLRIEAWGPTRERCIAEAIRATVTAYVDIGAAHLVRGRRRTLEPATDVDLLVTVLDDVIDLMDTAQEVPVDLEVTATDAGGLDVLFAMADLAGLRQLGPAPQGISLDDLEFGPGPRGWSCAVTVLA
jgi:SHS2 domain-containing protein